VFGGLRCRTTSTTATQSNRPPHRTHRHHPRRQSIAEKSTAQTAWEKSCYFKIDFKISEDAMMYEAVQR